MWERIKRWFSGQPEPQQPAPPTVGFQAPRPDLAKKEPQWIAAADNPFGVRVLDVRPVTLGTLSMSSDPRMAQNAVSYGGESGKSFVDEPPSMARKVAGSLRFRAPQKLVNGSLFIPQEMEDKWALFVQDQTLILVRGWQRRVFLRAALRLDGAFLDVTEIDGAVCDDSEPADYTLRALDFILHTHALRLPWPAPVLGDAAAPPRTLAIQCMSNFGRQALYAYACTESPPRDIPERPLHTMSELHLATLQNDLARAQKALADGVPVDLFDCLGTPALQYVQEADALFELLLKNGADVNLAAEDGTTPVMAATQTRRPEIVKALLARNAAPDAVDARGFSALHRAAEMGEAAIVAQLLARGADPDRVAEGGHTPRSLAEGRGHAELIPKRAK